MDIPVHVCRSLEKIERQNSQMLIIEWAMINPLVWDIHCWFDEWAHPGLPG